MKQLITILLILLSFTLARADEIREMRKDAMKLVSTALADGLVKVNGFSVERILGEMPKPKAYLSKHLIVQTGTREGASYQFNSTGKFRNWILFNANVYAVTPAHVRGPWMLHELLGVLGYPDRDYSMTLQIYFIAQGFAKDAIIAELVRAHNPIEFAEGGSGTSGGGGGDPMIIEIKFRELTSMMTLAKAQMTYKGVDLNRLSQIILDCSFEFYEGQTAVYELDGMREFGSTFPGLSQLKKPWAQIQIHRGWYFNQTNTNDEMKMSLILDGAVYAAQSKAANLCENPGRSYALEGSISNFLETKDTK